MHYFSKIGGACFGTTGMSICSILSGLVLSLCSNSVIAEELKPDRSRVSPKGVHSFSQPAANMPLMRRLDFSVGNSFFRNPWVAAPASTDARDGLGPLFNTNACQNCHIKDGRGHLPHGDSDNAVSLLLRLNVAGAKDIPMDAPNKADPIYGGQLQDFALPGLAAEGQISIRYEEKTIELADGSQRQLRKPIFSIRDLAYGPLHEHTTISARIAPAMVGLGLLEAIPKTRLRALADPEDRDQDGISGRINAVWDIKKQSLQAGRFGWKAGQPSLEQQNAGAFNGDMGIRSSLFPNENCTTRQKACADMAERGDLKKLEVSDNILEQITFYTRNLAVPKRRKPNDKEVVAGEAIFERLGCSGCHTPEHNTAEDYPLSWLAASRIAPYTDLLLHDMGPELADDSQEFIAQGNEWRTPPLWGLGMIREVNGVEALLHDGRARDAEEAILWHGGEGAQANARYRQLNKSEREQLLAFLYDL
ncbi:di-heme oxidoredictase family protein [Pseudoteredinibacter isoporae]|uniref:di-heme oxidoreductase family protein n=1 Tax=Pseudoteredinibacter isoporae TaxID=570281 RepID=UPI0031096D07